MVFKNRMNRVIVNKKYWYFYAILTLLLMVLVGTHFISPEIHDKVHECDYVDTPEEMVYIGVLAKRGEERCLEQWGATADFLTKEIPGHIFEIVPLNFNEVNDRVANHEVDFVLVNSSMYIDLEVNYGASRLVTLVNTRLGNPLLEFGGVIITRRDNDAINSMEDIQKKSFAAVSVDSFGGWQMAWKEFLDHDINPYMNFKTVDFLGTHDSVVYAVLSGQYDAGTVRTDTLERMDTENLIDIDEIKVVNSQEHRRFPFAASTDLYPEWPIAKTHHVDDRLAHEVALALMRMGPQDQAAVDAQIIGWEIPMNYHIVDETLKVLKIAPYEGYGEVSLADVIQQFQIWIMAMITAVILVFLLLFRATVLRDQLVVSLTTSKQLESKAKQASVAKSQFLANMSHEIRTPMNAIIGLSTLMFNTELNPKQFDYNEKINRSAKNLLAIINSILDYSKIEANKIELEVVRFNLDDVLSNIANIASLKAEEKGIELVFDIARNVPHILYGDPVRLTQILVNLANNALKFTKKGYIAIRISAKELESDQVCLGFDVEDSGIGMTQVQINKLFRPFTQADASTTRQFGGTGLGLTISKELVELMSGEISVSSEVGVGSTFHFFIRLKYETEVVTKPKVSHDMTGVKVLVVDDNEETRMILEATLSGFGLDVSLVSSGEEALTHLGKTTALPELVILDYKMPGMNGVETAKKIHEQIGLASIPHFLMVSAFGKDELMQQAQQVGISKFLDKPINPSFLFDSIMELYGNDVAELKSRILVEEVPENPPIDSIKGAHLLLAEDNLINQQVARELLQHEGFTVSIVGNGQAALDLLTSLPSDHFDAVLMDIQMPVMDGREATKKIREMPEPLCKIPIIAMTAHAILTEKERNIASGMDDQINKPVDLTDMLDALVRNLPPIEKNTTFHTKRREQEELEVDAVSDEVNGGEEKLSVVIKGMDTEAGLYRVFGDVDLYKELLEIFVAENQELLDTIQQNFGGGRFEENQRLAHSIKGSSGTVGAMTLSEAAKELEYACRDEIHDDRIIERFEQELKETLSNIKSFLG